MMISKGLEKGYIKLVPNEGTQETLCDVCGTTFWFRPYTVEWCKERFKGQALHNAIYKMLEEYNCSDNEKERETYNKAWSKLWKMLGSSN